MYKFLIVPLLALLIVMLLPAPVYAADCGWSIASVIFGCDPLKGVQDTAQQITELNAQKAQEIQRIQRQADLAIEQARQQGDLNQAMFAAYETLIHSKTTEQVAEIEQRYGLMVTALNNQTQIGLDAILQAGDTSRHRITWESWIEITKILAGSILSCLIVFAAFRLLAIYQSQQMQGQRRGSLIRPYAAGYLNNQQSYWQNADQYAVEARQGEDHDTYQ